MLIGKIEINWISNKIFHLSLDIERIGDSVLYTKRIFPRMSDNYKLR